MFWGKGEAQGGGVTALSRPKVVEAHPPRERSHSSKGCGVTLSSCRQPRSAGHSAWAKAGNLTVLAHISPVVYLEYPSIRPRHTVWLPSLCSCPTATSTQSSKLLGRCIHRRDPGAAQLLPTLWQGNTGKHPKWQQSSVCNTGSTGMLPKNAWLAASGFLPGSDKGIWKSPQEPQTCICSVNSLTNNRCLQRYKETSSKRKVKWKELQECNSSVSINNFLESLWFLSEYLPAQLLQWCLTWDNPGKPKPESYC